MGTLTATTLKTAKTVVTTSRNTLTASDVIPYSGGTGQYLELYNTTAAIVNVTITGSLATTISPAGLGTTVNVSAGITIAVAASGTTIVNLDNIAAYLSGNVTITGGTGIVAHLYN